MSDDIFATTRLRKWKIPGSRQIRYLSRLLIFLIPLVSIMLTTASCKSPRPSDEPVPSPPQTGQTTTPTDSINTPVRPTTVSSPDPSPMGMQRGAFKQASFFSPILNHDLEYQVYLPAGYEQNKIRYPVIYLLHGRGDTMYGWQYIQSDLDRMIAEGTIPPLIAVLPDVQASKGASYFVDSGYVIAPIQGEPVETAFVLNLIPHIDGSYRTIAKRSGRAIGGYSMGGYAAVRYPLAYPDLFSASIILSPAVYIPLPPDDSSARLFGAFGDGEEVFVDAIYQEKNYPALIPLFEKAQLPFYVYIAVGDDEWRNPLPNNFEHDLDFEAARLYNAFAHARFIVAQFRVLDGGHDWDVWQPAFIEGLSWISRFLDKPE